jgi:resolvase-like protein
VRDAGAEKVIRETASGARAARAQLRRVLAELDKGDVLMVTRLDRLARSTRDLLNTLAAITGKKAGFRSLGDTWADTTTAHGRLMLAVLGGLAEFERELIRASTVGERGQRLYAKVPHGHWKTTTFVAALRHDGITAPFVLDGPINGECFLAYVETVLVPTLSRGDIVLIDNLEDAPAKVFRTIRRSPLDPHRRTPQSLPAE